MHKKTLLVLILLLAACGGKGVESYGSHPPLPADEEKALDNDRAAWVRLRGSLAPKLTAAELARLDLMFDRGEEGIRCGKIEHAAKWSLLLLAAATEAAVTSRGEERQLLTLLMEIPDDQFTNPDTLFEHFRTVYTARGTPRDDTDWFW